MKREKIKPIKKTQQETQEQETQQQARYYYIVNGMVFPAHRWKEAIEYKNGMK